MTTPAEPPGLRRRAGAFTRLTLVVILAATIELVTGWTPVAAVTHHALLSSNPSNGSILETAPNSITMVFTEDVPDLSIAVTLTGPDGQGYGLGAPEINGTTVTQRFAPLTVAGEYALAYRIVVPQGPVGDVIRFSVGHGAAKNAIALEPTTTSAPTTDERTSTSIPMWVWGGLVAVAIAIAFTFVAIRRRGHQPPTLPGRARSLSTEKEPADYFADAGTSSTSFKTLPR